MHVGEPCSFEMLMWLMNYVPAAQRPYYSSR